MNLYIQQTDDGWGPIQFLPANYANRTATELTELGWFPVERSSPDSFDDRTEIMLPPTIALVEGVAQVTFTKRSKTSAERVATIDAALAYLDNRFTARWFEDLADGALPPGFADWKSERETLRAERATLTAGGST